MSREEAATIEEQTRMQAKSEEWFQVRAHRLTASTFNTDKKVMSFIEDSFTGNEHTDHGNLYEPVARHLLEEIINLKIENCGFFIHPKYNYMGTSPGGRMSLQGYLVEIKCPNSLPLEKPLVQCIKDKESLMNIF